MSLVRLILDWVVILILAAAGGVLFYITGWHRPFSLTDIEISYPDRPDIVSLPVLVIVSVLAPAVIIVAVSLITLDFDRRVGTWKQAISTLNVSLSALGLSLAADLFLTSGLKDIVGKPRPNLLDRCAADVSQLPNYMIGGLGDSIDSEAGALVRSEICRQTNKRLLDDGFAAFPSGHSSFSCAGLVFLSIWLAAMLSIPMPFTSRKRPSLKKNDDATPSTPLWKFALALAPAVGALFICTSRYADFHHAGIDIFAGAVLGTICAITSFRLHFRPDNSRTDGLSWSPRSKVPFRRAKRMSSGVASRDDEFEMSNRDEELGRADTFDSGRPIISHVPDAARGQRVRLQ